ncbi:MAG: molecular chaperone HtpG [Alphaproteobacteria bacterium]
MPETQQYEFQAEVSKVLKIVVDSLYSHSEIFLRELISNASDACDKLRYACLTHPDLMKDHGSFEITLTPDKAKNTLVIADNGIGMNKQDLIDNLGTIAKSGSAEFAAHLTGDNAKDLNLIGQFGVGFYSAFMVASKVEVRTKKAGDDTGWLWQSEGVGSFTITEDKKAPFGTSITLYLKKEFSEYTDPMRLRFIVKQYSDHISMPIVLDSAGKKETLNTSSALWTRPKSDITEEQYNDFYHSLTHNFDNPYLTIHYSAEGIIEYKALLFVPSKAPFDLFQPDKKRGLNLYVNRVFISNEVEEVLPHYLRFMQGVIDTNELPLNVSREMLQHTPVLAKIKNGITAHILEELAKKATDKESYENYWKEFGIVFKEGLYEDRDNFKKIAPLCLFYSSKTEALTSLSDYISRMPKEQKNIYYITGDDLNVLRNHPSLEGFTAKGIEVLLLTDPIDEFWPQVFNEWDGKKILPICSPDKDFEQMKNLTENTADSIDEAMQKVLIEKAKEILKGQISDVQMTNRLNKSPVALTAKAGQMSIHLERLMKQHGQAQLYASERILELNPRHPVIQKLAKAVFDKVPDDKIADAIWVLYDEARAIEGEPLSDPAGFMEKVNAFMEKGL